MSSTGEPVYDPWRSVLTIPLGLDVWVETVTGLQCWARVTTSKRWIRKATKRRPMRTPGYRLDTRGAVSIIAWRDKP